ncbi:MAG: GC-type dockerin domain-anchored protein [Planctomycetota bacterium]
MTRPLAALACASTLLHAAGTAAAQPKGYSDGTEDYYVFIDLMIDFDQLRDENQVFGRVGLPEDDDGDGGGMYCVPTSAADILAYAQAYGDFFVQGPGVGDWQSSDPGIYNFASVFINTLGNEMNTSPTGGTNNNNNQILNTVRDRVPLDKFDVMYFGRTNTWVPRADDLAGVLFQGGIAMFCYGRWDVDSSRFPAKLLDRNGGHCVVVTKVDNRAGFYNDSIFGDQGRISYRDPGTSINGPFSQSTFSNRVQDITTTFYENDDTTDLIEMTRIEISATGTAERLIDSMLVIMPQQGFSTSPDDDSIFVFGGGFSTVPPSDPDLPSFTLDVGGPIGGCLPSPDRGTLGVLIPANPDAGTPGTFRLADPGSREVSIVATFADPRSFVWGNNRFAYVLDGRTLVQIDPEPDTRGGEIVGTQVLNGPGEAPLAFCDEDPSLWLIAAGAGSRTAERVEINPDGSFGAQRSVPLPASTASFSAIEALDCDTGDLFALLGRDAAGAQVVQLLAYAGPTPALPAGSMNLVASYRPGPGSVLEGVSIGDMGHVFTIEDGAVIELEPVPGGALRPVVGAFTGRPANGFFNIGKSRTNFDPVLHSGPAWRNLDAAELAQEVVMATEADCRVDLARPFEVLDIFDVIEFLSRFEGGDFFADYNLDGLLDIFDVIEFLTLFDIGC